MVDPPRVPACPRGVRRRADYQAETRWTTAAPAPRWTAPFHRREVPACPPPPSRGRRPPSPQPPQHPGGAGRRCCSRCASTCGSCARTRCSPPSRCCAPRWATSASTTCRRWSSPTLVGRLAAGSDDHAGLMVPARRPRSPARCSPARRCCASRIHCLNRIDAVRHRAALRRRHGRAAGQGRGVLPRELRGLADQARARASRRSSRTSSTRSPSRSWRASCRWCSRRWCSGSSTRCWSSCCSG